jgi:hypothetical protein
MTDRPENLAFDAGTRAIDQQAAVLNELRNRAGILLAAGSLTAALLGSVALRDETQNLDGWEWAAVLFFGLLGASVLAILWPRQWRFRIHPHKLLTGYIDEPNRKPIDEIERNCAIYLGNYIDSNDESLRRMFWAFRVGSVSLMLQVLAWILDLS